MDNNSENDSSSDLESDGGDSYATFGSSTSSLPSCMKSSLKYREMVVCALKNLKQGSGTRLEKIVKFIEEKYDLKHISFLVERTLDWMVCKKMIIQKPSGSYFLKSETCKLACEKFSSNKQANQNQSKKRRMSVNINKSNRQKQCTRPSGFSKNRRSVKKLPAKGKLNNPVGKCLKMLKQRKKGFKTRNSNDKMGTNSKKAAPKRWTKPKSNSSCTSKREIMCKQFKKTFLNKLKRKTSLNKVNSVSKRRSKTRNFATRSECTKPASKDISNQNLPRSKFPHLDVECRKLVRKALKSLNKSSGSTFESIVHYIESVYGLESIGYAAARALNWMIRKNMVDWSSNGTFKLKKESDVLNFGQSKHSRSSRTNLRQPQSHRHSTKEKKLCFSTNMQNKYSTSTKNFSKQPRNQYRAPRSSCSSMTQLQDQDQYLIPHNKPSISKQHNPIAMKRYHSKSHRRSHSPSPNKRVKEIPQRIDRESISHYNDYYEDFYEKNDLDCNEDESEDEPFVMDIDQQDQNLLVNTMVHGNNEFQQDSVAYHQSRPQVVYQTEVNRIEHRKKRPKPCLKKSPIRIRGESPCLNKRTGRRVSYQDDKVKENDKKSNNTKKESVAINVSAASINCAAESVVSEGAIFENEAIRFIKKMREASNRRKGGSGLKSTGPKPKLPLSELRQSGLKPKYSYGLGQTISEARPEPAAASKAKPVRTASKPEETTSKLHPTDSYPESEPFHLNPAQRRSNTSSAQGSVLSHASSKSGQKTKKTGQALKTKTKRTPCNTSLENKPSRSKLGSNNFTVSSRRLETSARLLEKSSRRFEASSRRLEALTRLSSEQPQQLYHNLSETIDLSQASSNEEYFEDRRRRCTSSKRPRRLTPSCSWQLASQVSRCSSTSDQEWDN